VVWYEKPEETLADLITFLTHLMVYGSSADVSVAERYVPQEEFRRILEHAPPGVFSRDVWKKWHERFGMPVTTFTSAPVSRWFVRSGGGIFLWSVVLDVADSETGSCC